MTNETHTSPSIPEEWLSAYLDGELTSEERESVEAALAQSPSLQTTLGELRGVSELLKSLPKPTLDDSFASSLPLDVPVRASAGLPWKFGMTASALVAASLVAGVLWIQSDLHNEGRRGSVIASSDMAVAETAGEAEAMARPGMAAAPASTARLSMTPAPEVLAESVANTDAWAVEEVSDQFGRTLYAKSNQPQPGELLHVLQNVDGNVAVVECVVLDVREAMDELEVTLSRLGVEGANVSIGTEDASGDADQLRLPESGSDLLAVYVTGNESVVQAVMEQTRKGFVGQVASNALNAPFAQSRMSVPSAPSLAGSSAKKSEFADRPAQRFREMDTAAANQVGSVQKPAASPAKDGYSNAPGKAAVAEVAPAPVTNPVEDSAAAVDGLMAEELEKSSQSSRAIAREERGAASNPADSFSLENTGSVAMQTAGKAAGANGLQVQVALSDEVVKRIQTTNSFRAPVSNQRILVVLKKAPLPAGAAEQ